MKLNRTILICLLPFALAVEAGADITATVYPGYQFSATERPTVDTLNRAARPTVYVTGTLGGTNVSLGAKTVNGTMLADTVVDGVTTEYDGSTPRAIVVNYDDVTLGVIGGLALGVKTNGVTATQLATGSVTSGKILTNVFDGFTATTSLKTNDYFWVGVNSGTNAASVNSAASSVSLAVLTRFIATNAVVATAVSNVVTNIFSGTTFTSAEYSVALGTVANTAHGLAATPTIVRWVVVCKTTDGSFRVGDELDVSSVMGNNILVAAGHGANSTNVWLSFYSGNAFLYAANRTNNSYDTLTLSRWRAKCYARP